MNYLIVLLLLLGFILFYVQRRRYVLQRNFDRYVDMDASIILAKERVGTRRVYGSLIMELKHYTTELRSVYVSQLKSHNKDVQVKYFNALLFEVNAPGKNDIKLLSIGVRLSPKTEPAVKENRERVYVGGKLYLDGEKWIPFGKYLPVRSIR